MAAEEEARRAFALPPLPPDADLGDDIELAWLDPADPDERGHLIRAAHPEMDAALHDGEDEIDVGGHPVNMRLHLTMHEVVAQQLYDDEPPEAWETAVRLRDAGFPHHEVLHMLGAAASTQIWAALHEQRPYDRDEHVAALNALPGEWGGPPPSRDSHADARRRTRKAQRAARRRNRRR